MAPRDPYLQKISSLPKSNPGRPGFVFVLGLVLGLTAVAAGWAPDAAAVYKKSELKKIEVLPEQYRQWLLQVEPLISEEEFEGFLSLQKDYQRDAYIERFWKERDPYPETARNELKNRFLERIAFVQERYGNVEAEPARMLLLNGEPDVLLAADCPIRLYPTEVWFYDGSDRLPFDHYLVFYKRFGSGPFRLWTPFDGLDALFDTAFVGSASGISLENIRRNCRDGDFIAKGISWVLGQGDFGFSSIEARIREKPEPPTGEWVATFAAYSTELPEEASTFHAELQVAYPGRRQTRTVLQGIFHVPVAEAGKVDLAGSESYNFLLNGEILREGKLFEAFRYKFDFPAAEVTSETLPMVFQRTMRPGEYELVVKLEDLNGGRFFREQRQLVVPKLDKVMPAPPPDDPISARLLREANAAIQSGDTTIQLVEPHGELHAGLMRLETLTTGEPFAKVTFFLDGKPLLTKKRPPFSVEIDLGSLPRIRNLRAVGYDAEGQELASDEIELNSGGHRFAVRLVEPRKGKTYTQSLQAHAEVAVPDGSTLERVELFLNEDRLATLYQPPYEQAIVLPTSDEMSYVRAVAHLKDGNTTEDLVFINAPDYLEEVDVQFVELYTTVLDRSSRPVDGLSQDMFTIFEDGAQQEILRFEQVEDRPIHTGILLDVSASMEDSLDQVREAALGFFQTAIQPKDRGALITFNDRPQLVVKFSNRPDTLAGGLAGLKAERGTALYDSLIFTLYYFNGIRGQKAVLVLSDGKDESSRFSFEDSLEYAQRAGVTVYAIGLKEAAKDSASRKKLSKLADETGGRAFFIESPAQLASVYELIQKELRSQYLFAYQSSNTSGDRDFREIELKTSQRGLEIKTTSGYYP